MSYNQYDSFSLEELDNIRKSIESDDKLSDQEKKERLDKLLEAVERKASQSNNDMALDELTQDDIDKTMIPDMALDEFEILGKRVKIKPLTIKYQKQFAKLFSPVLQGVAMDLRIADSENLSNIGLGAWLTIANNIVENVDVMPEIIKVFCHNDGYMITTEQLDSSTMQIAEMQAIIIKYCKTGGALERKVADFFDHALPIINQKALLMVDLVRDQFDQNIQTMNQEPQPQSIA
jgi:hypothetical protein